MKIIKRASAFIIVLAILLNMLPAYAAYANLIIDDDCSDFDTVGYVTGTGFNPENVSITQQKAAYRFATTTKGMEGITSLRKKDIAYAGGAAEIIMKFKVNDLPVITSNPTYRGFGAELRAYDEGTSPHEYIKIMLSASTDGYVVFNIVNGINTNTGESIKSVYRVADKPTLDIKLEKSTGNLLTLTVNGDILKENVSAENAKTINSHGTSYAELFNCYYNADASYGVLDVELYSINIKSGTATLLSDDCTNLAGFDWETGTVYPSGSNNVTITQQEQQNYYKFQTVNKDSQGILTKRFFPEVNYEGGAAEIVMNIKVNDLPVITKNPTYRGFGVELCGYADSITSFDYIKVMLSASADGYIVFNIVNGNNANTGESVKSSYKVADKPMLDIKLDKNASGILTLIVNNEVLKTGVSAAAAKKTHTLGKSFVEFFNCYYDIDPTYGVIDVELNSLKVTSANSASIPEPENGRDVDLNAYMADPAPVVDGTLTDAGYNFLGHMTYTDGTGAPVNSVTAVQWDGEYLYFGVKYSGTATKYEATMNGTTVTYDIAYGSFGSVTGAEAVSAPGNLEMRIPYSAFALNTIDYNQVFENVQFKLSNEAGSAAMKGSMKLLGAGFIWEENFENYSFNDWSYMTIYTPGNLEDVFDIKQEYDENDKGYMKVNTKDYSINYIVGLRHAIPAYDNGYFTITFNAKFDDLPIVAKNVGWRGFGIEVRTATCNNRFNFSKDESGHILLDFLGGDRIDTGLVVGDSETHNIKITGDKETMEISLYVDGELTGIFAKKLSTYMQQTPGTGPRVELFFVNYDRPSASLDGGGCSLQISDFSISRPDYINPEALLDNLLKAVTWDTIKGENLTNEMIVSDVMVGNATSFTLPFIGAELPVTWKSSNAEIISDAGELLYTGSENVWVTLTASISYQGQTREKDFHMQVPGYLENGNVSFLRNDLNPFTGAFENWTTNTDFTLDSDLVSIGYDLGFVQRINRVLLVDNDAVSRIKEENLSLYVSNDNFSYTKVTDWSFVQVGNCYYIYNFDVNTRYVKIHSHFDSFEPYFDTSFQNNLKNIISAYYTNELIGANGGTFAKSKVVRFTNTSAGALEDYAAYILLNTLAIADDCKEDMSDVRFVLDDRTLYHYFDGEGFYVRVPYIAGSGIVDMNVFYSNADAIDVSTGEGTFEAIYGRINLFNTKVDNTSTGFDGEHKVRTMPNGDIIAIGSYMFYAGTDDEYKTLVLKRSTDGGRTWGTPVQISGTVEQGYLSGGGFVVDEETGRVFYFGFHYVGFVGTNMKASNCKMYYIYSDDNGYTWSDINYITNPGRPYSLSYCNAIMTSVYDGKGPNVDFVLTYSFQADNTGSFAVSAIYSTDAGDTWEVSDSIITMKAEGFEGGVSESALIELEDGTLYTVMRAQAASNDYFYASYSYDYGKTWDESATASNIMTTNTMPVFARYDGDILLLWQGNNTMGGISYRRFPLNISYSEDEGMTWTKILDLSLGTSLQIPAERRITQSDITFANYMGECDAVLVWCNMEGFGTMNAMLVEDFDKYLYKTQGAFDSFESTNARNEGWVQITTPFNYDISAEQAAEGSRSMKLTSDDKKTMVSRNIPSMKKGMVGYSLYLPEDFSTTFYTEFKAAYNDTLYKDTPIYFYINASGELCSKAIGKPVKVHATLSKGEWHDIEVTFDITAGTSIIYVDGQACGTLHIYAGSQVATIALTLASESSVYVDNFRASAANKYTNLLTAKVPGSTTPTVPVTPPAPITPDEPDTPYEPTTPDEPEEVVLPFSDVSVNDWFYDAVSYVYTNGMMSGTGEKTFAPNAKLSRAMIVAILWRVEGEPMASPAEFIDVESNKWYSKAIAWAAANGIVSGYSSSEFRPNTDITREQLAVILQRYAVFKGYEVNATTNLIFEDASSVSGWALDSMKWAVAEGLFHGKGNNILDAKGTATRAEAASILLRFMKNVVE